MKNQGFASGRFESCPGEVEERATAMEMFSAIEAITTHLLHPVASQAASAVIAAHG